MKHFFDKLYSLYSASPKNQNELAIIGNELKFVAGITKKINKYTESTQTS